MIKVLHLNHLVDKKDNNLTHLSFTISKSGINHVSMLHPYFGIVTIDIHYSVVIMYNEMLVTYNTSICM